MINKNKLVSIFVLVCFLLNILVYNTSFAFTGAEVYPDNTLSTSSLFNDLEGTEHKDIGNIKIGLEVSLMSFSGDGESIDIKTLVQNASTYKPTVFNNTHFFFSEVTSLSKDTGFIGIMCRVAEEVNGNQVVRTYYAVFPHQADSEGGFPIEVYTEEEWEKAQRIINATRALPLRELWKEEDSKTIKRYQEHEENIDAWIRKKMTEGGYAVNNLFYNAYPQDSIDQKYSRIYQNAGYTYNWQEQWTILNGLIESQIKALGGGIKESRIEAILDVFSKKPIVFLEKKKGENYPAIEMHDADGNPVTVEVHAHSSDHAIYIILDEELFSSMTKRTKEEPYTEVLRRDKKPLMIFDLFEDERVAKKIFDTYLYEVGVHCGLTGWVDDDHELTNDLVEADKVYRRDPAAYQGVVDDLNKTIQAVQSKSEGFMATVNIPDVDIFKAMKNTSKLKPVASLSETSKTRDYAAGKKKTTKKKAATKKTKKKKTTKTPKKTTRKKTAKKPAKAIKKPVKKAPAQTKKAKRSKTQTALIDKYLETYVLYSEDLWKAIKEHTDEVTAGFLMRLVDEAFREEMAQSLTESDIEEIFEEFAEELDRIEPQAHEVLAKWREAQQKDIFSLSGMDQSVFTDEDEEPERDEDAEEAFNEIEVIENAINMLHVMGMRFGNRQESIINGLLGMLRRAHAGEDFREVTLTIDTNPSLSSLLRKIRSIVNYRISLYGEKPGYWTAQKIAEIVYSAYIDDIGGTLSSVLVQEHAGDVLGGEPVKPEDFRKAEEILLEVCLTEEETAYAKKALSLAYYQASRGKDAAVVLTSAISAVRVSQPRKGGKFDKKPGRSPEGALKVIALYDFMPESFTVQEYNRIYKKVKILFPYELLQLSELPLVNPDAQSRADLNRLVERDILAVDDSSRPYKYTLTEHGRGKVEEMRSLGLEPQVSQDHFRHKFWEIEQSTKDPNRPGDTDFIPYRALPYSASEGSFLYEPLSSVAQGAYEDIILLAELVEEYKITLTPKEYVLICYAWIFRRSNFRKVIDFFEGVKRMPKNDELRIGILSKPGLVHMYFLARLMDLESMEIVKNLDPQQSFLDYYWEKLSGIRPAPVTSGFPPGVVHRAIMPLVDTGEGILPDSPGSLVFLDVVAEWVVDLDQIYCTKGEVYRRERNFSKAKDYYRRALQAMENVIEVYRNEAHFAAGRFEFIDVFERLNLVRSGLLKELEELDWEDPGSYASAQNDGSVSGDEADRDISSMVPYGDFFQGVRSVTEKITSLSTCDEITTAISELSRKMATDSDGKKKAGAIDYNKVGLIPVSSEEVEEKAFYTLAVRVYPDLKKRQIGIYETFVDGINRLKKLITVSGRESAERQEEVIETLIRGSVLHELGHGFDNYSGLDLYSLAESEDAIETYREFAELAGYYEDALNEPEGRRRFAEFIADLNMAGPGGKEYVRNKGAYLFYKFITSDPNIYIGNKEALASSIREYYQENPHLKAALTFTMAGGVHEKGMPQLGDNVKQVVDEALRCHDIFFAEGTVEKKEFTLLTCMNKYAGEVGIEIAPPVKDYTLFVCSGMYNDSDKDYEKDEGKYGSRFNLERIPPGRPDAIIRRIIYTINKENLDPKNVMVQLPSEFGKEEYYPLVEKLLTKASGVRFMIMDTAGLRGLKDVETRATYRRNIYSMMLLARKIDEHSSKDSKLYNLLDYFLEGCIGDTATRYAYINALIELKDRPDNVLGFILRPIVKYRLPEYGIVSKTLTQA